MTMAWGAPMCAIDSGVVAVILVALLVTMQTSAAAAVCPSNPPGFVGQAACPATDEGATCTVACPLNTTQETTLTCKDGGRWQAQPIAGCMTAICRVCQCSDGPLVSHVSCAAGAISPQHLAGISPTVTDIAIRGSATPPTENFNLPVHVFYYAQGLRDLELSNLAHLEFEVMTSVLDAATPVGQRLAPLLQRLRISNVASADTGALRAVVNRLAPSSCDDSADLTFDFRNSLLWAGAETDIPWRPLLRARRLVLTHNALQTLRTDAIGLDDLCCLHEFDASANNLTDLGSTLMECDELQSLELQDNALTHIRERSINLQPTLTHLDLTNNAVAFIDTFVFDRAFHRNLAYWRPTFQALHMAGNPSTCILTIIGDGDHYVTCACANGYKDVPSCPRLGTVACGSHPRTAIEPSRLCDGVADCPDAWDEQQCTARLVAAEENACTIFTKSTEPCPVTCRKELRLTAFNGYVNITSSPDACDDCPLGIGSIVDGVTGTGILGWASFSFELERGLIRMRGDTIARDNRDSAAIVIKCNDLYRVVNGSWLGLSAAVSATASLTTPAPTPMGTTSAIPATTMAPKCPQRTDNFLATACQRAIGSRCVPQCSNQRIGAFPITCDAGAVWNSDPCLEVGTACGGIAVLSSRDPKCSNAQLPLLSTTGHCNVTCTDGSSAFAVCRAGASNWRFFVVSNTGQVEAVDAEVCGLKPANPSSPSSSSSPIGAGAIVGIAVGAVAVTLATLAAVLIVQRRRGHNTSNKLSAMDAGILEQRQQRILHELERCNVLVTDLGTGTRSSLQSITRSELTLGKELGRGAFGVVHYGVWSDKKGRKTEIAAKTVTAGAFAVDEQASFLVEAQLMSVLSHPSLVRVLGLSADGDAPLLVMEFLRNGNLRDYLRDQALQEPLQLTAQQLLEACIAIADGMAYLAARNVIHRDLACRNILVGASMAEVKISDYGMARYLAQGDYYRMTSNKALPIAWMAPESISGNKWSSRSDVWSAGITFWEIFSLGETPFSSLSFQQILNAHSAIHVHLSPPPMCPNAMYTVITGCWRVDPNIRPSFEYLLVQLTQLRDEMRAGKHCDIGATTPPTMSTNRRIDFAHRSAPTSTQSAATPMFARSALETAAPSSTLPPRSSESAAGMGAIRTAPAALPGATTVRTDTAMTTDGLADTTPTAAGTQVAPAPTTQTRTGHAEPEVEREVRVDTSSPAPSSARLSPSSARAAAAAKRGTPRALRHADPSGARTSSDASEQRRRAWVAVAGLADEDDDDEETRL